jgi:uncharacterized protein YndB with AHSA1/START domain
MDVKREAEAVPPKHRATVEQKSERELVITRLFDSPAHLVFAAWTKPEIFKQWWVPKSCGLSLLSCELDVRAGGKYRLLYNIGVAEPMAFYGRYLDVIPDARISWTNEEAGDAGQITTVTFEDVGDQTRIVHHELFPNKDALDEARASGSEAGMIEAFDQLGDLLPSLGAGTGRT